MWLPAPCTWLSGQAGSQASAAVTFREPWVMVCLRFDDYSVEELEYHYREVIFAAVHVIRLNIHPSKVGHVTGPAVGGCGGRRAEAAEPAHASVFPSDAPSPRSGSHQSAHGGPSLCSAHSLS